MDEKLEKALEMIHETGALDCSTALAALRGGFNTAEALKLIKPGRRQRIDTEVRAVMQALAIPRGRR